MARGHWLDPLARQILRATGNLPSKTSHPSNQANHLDPIEIELKALKEEQNILKQESAYFIDVNRAKPSDWLTLPGCTEEMAQLLIRLQRAGVQLSGEEDLFQLLELPQNIANQWKPFLLFHWYGSAPPLPNIQSIDLNSAPISKVKDFLNWPEDRIQRLSRERQKNQFTNLADFQERLMLPASEIEKLIGAVRFGNKRPGPMLPPKC